MEAANVIAFGAFLFSGASVIVAHWSYRHSKQTEQRLLEDERLIFGPLMHPELRELSHSRCALAANVVNLGHRKAIITEVTASDSRGNTVDVKWSDCIDDCGNPMSAHGLVLVDPKCTLYARRCDGLPFANGTALTIRHSQSNGSAILRFNDQWATWS